MRGLTYVELLLGNLGTLVDGGVEGVAELDLLRPLGELGQELVVDLRVNEDTRASAASLSVVPAKID